MYYWQQYQHRAQKPGFKLCGHPFSNNTIVPAIRNGWQALIKGACVAEEELKEQGKVKKKVPREITFRCQSCDKYKLLEEMRVITRFFPLLVVCRECEKEMR